MKFLYLDTETTGLDPRVHSVIQVAGIIEVDGKVEREFNFKSRPFSGATISDDALKISGHTREEIACWDEPGKAYRALYTILDGYVDKFDKTAKDRFIMVGQNPKFDYDFMESFFSKNGDRYWYSRVHRNTIDLIALTTMFRLAGVVKIENAKLSTVARHFGIDLIAHDAINDIRATREIFQRYIEMVKPKEN